MYNDHPFDPQSDAERLAEEQEAELRRKIRREVRRVQSGEADAELQEDLEQETELRQQQEAERIRAERRRSNLFWMIVSGSILVREGAKEYYRYLACVAAMFFVSIVVMFWSLHLDMKYTRLERQVQVLRERSIRLQEERFRTTSHSAVSSRLRERGIDLRDPISPSEILEQ